MLRLNPAFLCFFVCLTLVAQNKPNFIIIFSDDQGYQDLGCFGSPKIKTPNLVEECWRSIQGTFLFLWFFFFFLFVWSSGWRMLKINTMNIFFVAVGTKRRAAQLFTVAGVTNYMYILNEDLNAIEHRWL